MGQTFFLMGLLAVYLAVVAALYWYAKNSLRAFLDDLGPISFWAILAAPLVCILLFQMMPTALRALRERRLRAMTIGGFPKPGYFRLQPYTASDHDAFERLDGADREVLDWLKSAKLSLLYLSGASGVGKSSLLSAAVLPELHETRDGCATLPVGRWPFAPLHPVLTYATSTPFPDSQKASAKSTAGPAGSKARWALQCGREPAPYVPKHHAQWRFRK
jgi:hypothetical protein